MVFVEQPSYKLANVLYSLNQMKTQAYLLLICILIVSSSSLIAQKKIRRTDSLHIPIGFASEPSTAEVGLVLSSRFQQYRFGVKNANDHYDLSIYSPKSASFSADGKKFYIQSLEGFTTTVYDTDSMKRIKIIRHEFTAKDKHLFKDDEYTIFEYPYQQERKNYNIFKGKPVESCLSHGGKYLWVSYYRRDYDAHAVSPSAIAIIDTEKDSIVRVMPTGPLPKMVACSPDNKFIAVTHWGDNTVGIIDISSDTISNFHYIAHSIIDYKASNNFSSGKYVNRDRACGKCLRGTVFTPDSNYLLIGKMGGGGIAVIELDSFHYLGTIRGMKTNVRHLSIHGENFYLSSNRTGYIQKTHLKTMLDSFLLSEQKTEFMYANWQSCYVGAGARTIELTSDGAYLFAAVNNHCKVAVVRTSDMKKVSHIKADAYPVGMAISPDNKKLIVTSQGRKQVGGNSVMIFDIIKK